MLFLFLAEMFFRSQGIVITALLLSLAPAYKNVKVGYNSQALAPAGGAIVFF